MLKENLTLFFFFCHYTRELRELHKPHVSQHIKYTDFPSIMPMVCITFLFNARGLKCMWHFFRGETNSAESEKHFVKRFVCINEQTLEIHIFKYRCLLENWTHNSK